MSFFRLVAGASATPGVTREQEGTSVPKGGAWSALLGAMARIQDIILALGKAGVGSSTPPRESEPTSEHLSERVMSRDELLAIRNSGTGIFNRVIDRDAPAPYGEGQRLVLRSEGERVEVVVTDVQVDSTYRFNTTDRVNNKWIITVVLPPAAQPDQPSFEA